MSKYNCKLNYIQLSVPDFLDNYPDAVSCFSSELILYLLSESEYVVRFDVASGLVEFGFPSDDWKYFK